MVYDVFIYIEGFVLGMSTMLLTWATCAVFRAFKTVVT